MSSENDPLIVSPAELAHEALYNRFSPSQKRVIVMLVSCSALLPMFASGSFIPTIPQIAEDLNTAGPVISFAVSLSIFGAALGSLLFATYSGHYGRRPMYLCGLPLLCLGSIGVARASTVPELMTFRFIQAFGTSGGLAVGGGVIGDIYKLTERGTAMGIFFAASLLGNAVSPIIGGWGAKYSSWRNVQFGLFFVGLSVFLGMLTFLPETSHPGTMGMDKVEPEFAEDHDGDQSPVRKFKWVWLNPFSCLWLLRSPNVLFVTLAGFTVLYTDYALILPIAYTIVSNHESHSCRLSALLRSYLPTTSMIQGARYNITNAAIIGACFLPIGLGNIIGAPLAGILSDRLLIKWRKRRGGVWVPEDRLRATLFGAATLVPLSVVVCGLLTHFVDGPLGLFLNLVSFFFNGLGVDLVLSPSSAYIVDIVHARSAEIMAASVALRSLILSIAISGILPSIGYFGLVATNTAVGILAWGGFLLLWLTIKYGEPMRKWVDIGYSTVETT